MQRSERCRPPHLPSRATRGPCWAGTQLDVNWPPGCPALWHRSHSGHVLPGVGSARKGSQWPGYTRDIQVTKSLDASFLVSDPPQVKSLFLTRLSSVAQSCLNLRNPVDCSTPGHPVHHQLRSLLELMSIELVMPSNHLILCHPLLLLPSIFPSIRVFPNESVLQIRWPKYWSFSFSISLSSEHPGLISFRMDWLDLLAVQGTLKSLLQHHSTKASILRHSAFFIIQLSQPYYVLKFQDA